MLVHTYHNFISIYYIPYKPKTQYLKIKVTQRMAHTYTNTPKASVTQSKSMPQPTTFQSLLSGVINGEKLLWRPYHGSDGTVVQTIASVLRRAMSCSHLDPDCQTAAQTAQRRAVVRAQGKPFWWPHKPWLLKRHVWWRCRFGYDLHCLHHSWPVRWVWVAACQTEK